MTARENVLRLYHRCAYESVPVYFVLCPALEREFHRRHPHARDYLEHFQFPMRVITDPGFPWIAEVPGFVPPRRWDYALYYDPPIAPGARMDIWGIAHEPGGAAAQHMTHMRHPLEAHGQAWSSCKSYPWPEFDEADWSFVPPRSRGDPGPRAGGPSMDGMHHLGDGLVPAADGPVDARHGRGGRKGGVSAGQDHRSGLFPRRPLCRGRGRTFWPGRRPGHAVARS